MNDPIQFPPQARAIRSSEIRELRAKNPTSKKRKPNYASPNRGASERHQRLILALLRVADGPLSVRDVVDATGLSRQLAHYQLKKLAYRREIVWLFDRGKRGDTAVKIHYPTAELRRALGWQLAAPALVEQFEPRKCA
jgi:hypothetical protein